MPDPLEFRVTFGGQYGSASYGADPHPVLGYEYCHHDGWLTVLAGDYDQARHLTTVLLWTAWSNIYAAEDHAHDEALYPRGELLRVDATTDPVVLPPEVLRGLWSADRAVGLTYLQDTGQRIVHLEDTSLRFTSPSEAAGVVRVDKYSVLVDGVRVTADAGQEARLQAMSDAERARFARIMGG